MRLLVVSHYYSEHRGGVEMVANEIARRLAAEGCEIEWAASDEHAPAPTVAGLTRLPMRAWNITERRLGVPYPLWGPVSLTRLYRAVGRADVVHLHDCLYLGSIAACLFALLRRKPIVVTQHIGLVPYSNRLLRSLMSFANHTVGRLVLRRAAQVVLISAEVQAYFSRFVRFRRPPRLIPNGVDRAVFHPLDPVARASLKSELGWPADRPCLLFVGRFVEKKGLHHLRRLAERFSDCFWTFVGWGAEDPRSWRLPNVGCPGSLPQAEVVRRYRAADLLVLPSRGEGFPLVVQEAMACGTPALISRETSLGVPEIAGHCLISDVDDAALAACLHEALGTPGRLESLRAAATEFAVQHWDWDASIARYREILDDCAGRR
jgi:glycosyltransferase involved in cell wall biosynthesis